MPHHSQIRVPKKVLEVKGIPISSKKVKSKRVAKPVAISAARYPLPSVLVALSPSEYRLVEEASLLPLATVAPFRY